MNLYHRHLDHAWRRTRDQINYSLFGNIHGEVAVHNNGIFGNKPPWTKEALRAERWRIRYICENVSIKCKCIGHSKRQESLAWLRYKEFEA